MRSIMYLQCDIKQIIDPYPVILNIRWVFMRIPSQSYKQDIVNMDLVESRECSTKEKAV